MNIYQIVITVVVTGVVCGAVGFLFPYLKKKGIDAPNAIKGVETGLEEIGTVIQTGQQILGDKVSKAANILNFVDKLALKATKDAQQLAISSQLPLEERKEKAKETILTGLEAAKIKVTPQLEKIIDATIQEMVFDSKTPEEQRDQTQNTLSQQIAQLQVQVSQLTTEKAQLQQQISTIQSTVQASQSTVTQAAQN